MNSLPLVARLLGYANTLSRGAAWVGGAIMLASVLLISFDVLAR